MKERAAQEKRGSSISSPWPTIGLEVVEPFADVALLCRMLCCKFLLSSKWTKTTELLYCRVDIIFIMENHDRESLGSNSYFLDIDSSTSITVVKSSLDDEDSEQDKTVCPAFCVDCDSVSIKSGSGSGVGGSSPTRTPDTIALTCDFQMFGSVTDHSSLQDPSRPSVLSSDVPLDDATCDNLDIPLEVSAVLLELPAATVLPPPPPYTLVRGRRMRFIPQRMHLPTSASPRLYQSDGLYNLHAQQQQQQQQETTGKGCCASLMIPGSLNVRWFIIVISFIALCCVVVGIVLGALKGANEFTGDDSLTIALLLIGVGIILMTVSGVAWRLTARQGTETSLRNMLGFGSMRVTSPALQSFRRAPSGPFSAYVFRNSFGRSCPGYYYEYQFRPPPPSYHASMTDYRVRTLFDRNRNNAVTGNSNNRTPPPVYRTCLDPSNPLPLLNQLTINEFLCQPPPPRSAPPSYRSRTGLEAASTTTTTTTGRERASLGQVNAIFNENYRTLELSGDDSCAREELHITEQASTSANYIYANLPDTAPK